jgi:pyruvate dehydrogenase E2 component (dihydrolipoamide acetyltransferase)
MLKEITVPEISENVESGEVLNILVSPGDRVSPEQPLVELETEKAAFEVPSTTDGEVKEILIKEGDTVTVGQPIVRIDTEGKGKPEKKSEEKTPEGEEAPEEKPGREERREKKSERRIEPEEQAEEEPKRMAGTIPAAPSVRQLARELGIEIKMVSGTGPGGRISDDDVKKHARQIITQSSADGRAEGAAAAAPQTRPLPDFSKWGDIERKPASATRKKIADTMSYAWLQAAHVTQHDTADITLLHEFIAEYSEQVRQAGGKLTVTSILLNAAAKALRDFPELNTSYDAEAEEIIYKKYIHIAVAVDTDRGLLVPVVRDADRKSIRSLSAELSALAQKAREHKITPDEMQGGTFTVTNLGGIGGTYFTPIVYWPQVAILGISRAVQQSVYAEGGVENRWMLPLSLSYDHRIIDGAVGIRFLRKVIELLENPFHLALEETADGR